MVCMPAPGSIGAFRDKRQVSLRRGPWLWAEQEVTLGEHQRPEPRVGTVPLVTDASGRGELWCLSLDGADSAGAVPFATEGEAAWRNARAALSRTLPLLWSPIDVVPHLPPRAPHLGSAAATTSELGSSPVISGSSFGAALYLAMASRLTHVPPAVDVVVSVSVDAFGNLGTVDGLLAKARVVLELAPGVRRFLVHHNQADALTAVVAELGGDETRLKVVGIGSIDDLLRHGLADGVVIDLGGITAERKAKVVTSLFNLARTTGTGLLSWEPVARACEALQEDGSLPRDLRCRVAFALMTSRRHHGNRAALARDLALVNDNAWLATLPAPVRVEVVASLLQQHVDTGAPSAERCDDLYRSHTVPAHEAFPAHLKLRGAFGRVLARRRAFDDAMALQREAAMGWFDIHVPDQASYPMSEWYRLVPLVSAPEQALLDVEQFRANAEARGYAPVESAFARLYRARAMRRLIGDDTEVVATLRSLSEDSHVPSHVVLSALRELTALGGDIGGDARRRLADGSSAEADAYRDLVALDDAVASGDDAQAQQVVGRLLVGEETKGIVGDLKSFGLSPARVAIEFPY
jgi:hypothetical protein